MRRMFEIRAALGLPSASTGAGAVFKPAELRALDKLLGFLSDPAPYFQPGNATDNAQLVAVCGNWYDLPHKAQILARTPKTTELLLAGGRAERLTSADAERVGGEPLLLQRRLVEKYGVDVRRTIVWSGSRVTNHNLLAALAYAKQVRDFSQRRTDTTFVEERFLVRREAASAHAAFPRSRASTAGATTLRWRCSSASSIGSSATRRRTATARRPPTEAGSARTRCSAAARSTASACRCAGTWRRSARRTPRCSPKAESCSSGRRGSRCSGRRRRARKLE